MRKAPLMLSPAIAPKLHRRCTGNAPELHRGLIVEGAAGGRQGALECVRLDWLFSLAALKKPWNCPATALKLPCNCPESALKVPWKCPESALKLPWNYPETALKLHWNWPEITLKLHWNCTETALSHCWNSSESAPRRRFQFASEWVSREVALASRPSRINEHNWLIIEANVCHRGGMAIEAPRKSFFNFWKVFNSEFIFNCADWAESKLWRCHRNCGGGGGQENINKRNL